MPVPIRKAESDNQHQKIKVSPNPSTISLYPSQTSNTPIIGGTSAVLIDQTEQALYNIMMAYDEATV